MYSVTAPDLDGYNPADDIRDPFNDDDWNDPSKAWDRQQAARLLDGWATRMNADGTPVHVRSEYPFSVRIMFVDGVWSVSCAWVEMPDDESTLRHLGSFSYLSDALDRGRAYLADPVKTEGVDHVNE